MTFEGLRVEPSGAIVAYLPAGVVRLEPDEADAARAPGWYDWSWRKVADPTAEVRGDAGGKVSKASVNYEDVGPPARRCALCTMFIPTAACSHVAGEISPDGTCEDFEMKLDDAKLDEALRRADAMARKDVGDYSDVALTLLGNGFSGGRSMGATGGSGTFQNPKVARSFDHRERKW